MSPAAADLIAAAQAITRNHRHMSGLLAEIAGAPRTDGPDGTTYIQVSARLLDAIERSAR